MKKLFLLAIIGSTFTGCSKSEEFCSCLCEGLAVDEIGVSIRSVEETVALNECAEDIQTAENECFNSYVGQGILGDGVVTYDWFVGNCTAILEN